MKKAWMSTVLLAGLTFLGCGDQADTKATIKKDDKAAAKVDNHSGWWCDEHGVKESECSMCSAKVAKACIAKGDWCKEHERAKSQCFICDPKLKDKFAAEYVAKYGKQPPEPEGQVEEKKDEKKGK